MYLEDGGQLFSESCIQISEKSGGNNTLFIIYKDIWW